MDVRRTEEIVNRCVLRHIPCRQPGGPDVCRATRMRSPVRGVVLGCGWAY